MMMMRRLSACRCVVSEDVDPCTLDSDSGKYTCIADSSCDQPSLPRRVSEPGVEEKAVLEWSSYEECTLNANGHPPRSDPDEGCECIGGDPSQHGSFCTQNGVGKWFCYVKSSGCPGAKITERGPAFQWDDLESCQAHEMNDTADAMGQVKATEEPQQEFVDGFASGALLWVYVGSPIFFCVAIFAIYKIMQCRRKRFNSVRSLKDEQEHRESLQFNPYDEVTDDESEAEATTPNQSKPDEPRMSAYDFALSEEVAREQYRNSLPSTNKPSTNRPADQFHHPPRTSKVLSAPIRKSLATTPHRIHRQASWGGPQPSSEIVFKKTRNPVSWGGSPAWGSAKRIEEAYRFRRDVNLTITGPDPEFLPIPENGNRSFTSSNKEVPSMMSIGVLDQPTNL